MWHKAVWMVQQMRLELTREGLLVSLANRYTEVYRWSYEYFNQPSYNGLVSLFNGISALFRLLNAKAILLEEQ